MSDICPLLGRVCLGQDCMWGVEDDDGIDECSLAEIAKGVRRLTTAVVQCSNNKINKGDQPK